MATKWASRLLGVRGPVERRAEPPALYDLLTGAGGSSSRYSVTYDSAQAHSAVYACVDLLVRLVVWQMPVSVIGSGEAPKPLVRPAQFIANPHPEPHMLAEHWRAMVLESATLRGYAVGVVTSREPTGWPRQILPQHPDSLSWYKAPDGGIEWRLNGQENALWQNGGDLWLTPSLSVTPGAIVGKSVLSYAAQKVKLGLAANKFGFDFFDAGGIPVSHVKVQTDGAQVTPEQAKVLKQRVLDATRNRSPLVSGEELTLDTIAINAEESQFLQTMQANVADVCRFFGIPPEAIGGSSGDSMTYANVEGRNLSLLTNTVGAWMNWFERVLASMLPRPQLVELDPKALLRTSVSTNFDNAQKGFGMNQPGFMTLDEARVSVGLSPLGGAEGGQRFVPVNYVPAGLLEEVLLPDQGMVGNGEPSTTP